LVGALAFSWLIAAVNLSLTTLRPPWSHRAPGGNLASLIFACPKTRRPIESGIEIDQGSFAAVRPLTLSVRCPHCWEKHSLTLREGYLAPAA
jgi:hypothetical protein